MLLFDHDCTWLGMPIGAGNHRAFFWFTVAGLVLLGLYIPHAGRMLYATGFLPRAADSGNFFEPGGASLRARILAVGMLISLLLGVFLAGILLFMSILLSNNWLMAEILDEKKRPQTAGDEEGPAYDKYGYGCCFNWLLFCRQPLWRMTPPDALRPPVDGAKKEQATCSAETLRLVRR